MLFFSLRGDIGEPIVVKDTSGNPLFSLNVVPLDYTEVNEHGIYCSSVFEIRQLSFLINQKYGDTVSIQIYDDQVIENSFNMPAKLGAHVDKDGKESVYSIQEQRQKWVDEETKKVNLLLCNMYGNSYIDAYVSANIQRKITESFIDAGIAIGYEGTISMSFPQPGLISSSILPLNNYSPSIFSLAKLLEFDGYWSLQDLNLRVGYGSEEPFDFFSRQLGLPETERAHEFYIDPVTRIQTENKIKTIKGNFSAITLIQTSGTYQVNSMPDKLAKEVVTKLSQEYPETLFVVDNTFGEDIENLISLSSLSNNINQYIILMENIDNVISTYSLSPFVCDYLEIPCFTISTSMNLEGKLSKTNGSTYLHIADHGHSDPTRVFDNLNQEQIEEIWKDTNAEKIITGYKSLPHRSSNKKYTDTTVSGAKFLAKANNPEL